MINSMVAVVFTTDILNYLANETGGEHEFLTIIAVAATLTWLCAGTMFSRNPTEPWKLPTRPRADSDAPAIGRHRAQ